jgi:hypothetical protein
MVLETLIASAAGYIIKGLKDSKGGKQAQDETSVAIWNWIRPLFLEDDPKTLEKIEKTNPDQVQPLVELAIEKKATDKAFIEELEKKVNALEKAGVTSGGNRMDQTGNHNFGVQDIHGSTISIHTSPPKQPE